MQLPKRLMESYERFISDPQLMSGREDVAILKCRQEELANRLDTGESGALWDNLAESYAELRAAMAAGDKDASKDAFNQIGVMIEKGQADGAIWNEFRELTLEVDQLKNSETKRLKEAGRTLTVQEATAFAGALTMAVKNNVLASLKEIGQEKLAKQILRKINEEIRELMTLSDDDEEEDKVVEGRIA